MRAQDLIGRLRARPEWRFFAVLPKADRRLAAAWWTLLLLDGALPAAFAVIMGDVVTAVEGGASLGPPLAAMGVVFVAMQVLPPLHSQVGTNLGDALSNWLNDRLIRATTGPQSMAHLERPDLTDDLTLARDFDLGIAGPPMSISMGFIAGGLGAIVAGLAQAVVLTGYRWWASLLLGLAWGSTHWLLRESAIWRERNTEEVMDAQRHADYTYRMAVDPPAAKELRLFGLADWAVDLFAGRRRRLVDLRWEATRLRQKPMRWALGILVVANAAVFASLAFGGLNWSLTMAAAPAVDAVLRLDGAMAAAGSLPDGSGSPGEAPTREIRFRDVTFSYPTSTEPVLEGFDLTVPAGSSLAIVGQNGAGKTTLAKLLCRLYDPQGGAVEVDGTDVRELRIDAWRGRIAAVFQDFVRYEWPLRDNVAPRGGADDAEVTAALEAAGGGDLAELDRILAKGYEGGTDLSGGQWQRVALARALHAVRSGAGVVILDEPTAQLDARGEAEIFGRILAATRDCTTILISHRFSTVRHADRICVLEAGRVVELGTHDELMALGGRYHTMFELQASRFTEDSTDGLTRLA